MKELLKYLLVSKNNAISLWIKTDIKTPSTLRLSPFCRTTDTPILDFWWHLLEVLTPAWISSSCSELQHLSSSMCREYRYFSHPITFSMQRWTWTHKYTGWSIEVYSKDIAAICMLFKIRFLITCIQNYNCNCTYKLKQNRKCCQNLNGIRWSSQ